VATGLFPAAAGARSVTEKLGIRYVYASYQPVTLPSPRHPPYPRPGRPLPPEVTDNRVLWDLDAQSVNALFGAALSTHRASIGLPPAGNVRDHVFTDHPWLAADPTLSPWQPADLDVVQTGAWILPDERPLAAGLVAFLDAGTPPVYAGFGSMPRCWPTRSAGKGRQCPREPHGTGEPGTPRTREPANPGDLNRQRPRGRRQAERCSSWPPGSSRQSRRLAAPRWLQATSDRS
jgi:hypothetical protein